MFPYKSAVGFFIIQILKALALIKAVAIYPVSSRPDPELLCRSFVRARKLDDGRPCKHEKTHTRLHMAQSSRCARDREQQAVDVLALEKNLRGLTWFRTPLEQAGLLSRRGIASPHQMVAVSPLERSCEEIRL